MDMKIGDKALWYRMGRGNALMNTIDKKEVTIVKLANLKKDGSRCTIQWYDHMGRPHRRSVSPDNVEVVRDDMPTL